MLFITLCPQCAFKGMEKFTGECRAAYSVVDLSGLTDGLNSCYFTAHDCMLMVR